MKYALRVAALWHGTLVQELLLTSGRVTLGGRDGVLLPDEQEGVTLATIGVDTPYATIPLRGDMCGRVIRDGVVHALRCDVPTDLRPGEAAILKLDDVSVYLQWVELDVREHRAMRRSVGWGNAAALASAALISVVAHAAILMAAFLQEPRAPAPMLEGQTPCWGAFIEPVGLSGTDALHSVDPEVVLRDVFGMRGVYRPFGASPLERDYFRINDRAFGDLTPQNNDILCRRGPTSWPGLGVQRGLDRPTSSSPTRASTLRARDGTRTRVRYGVMTASGGVRGVDALERATRRHRRGLRHCFERGGVQNPLLAGTLTLRWTVGADGRVYAAHVLGGDLGDVGVAECARREIERIRFDAAAGETLVTQTLGLDPE